MVDGFDSNVFSNEMCNQIYDILQTFNFLLDLIQRNQSLRHDSRKNILFSVVCLKCHKIILSQHISIIEILFRSISLKTLRQVYQYASHIVSITTASKFAHSCYNHY